MSQLMGRFNYFFSTLMWFFPHKKINFIIIAPNVLKIYQFNNLDLHT